MTGRYALENRSHRIISTIISFLEYSLFIPKPRKIQHISMGEPNFGSYVIYGGFTIMCSFINDNDYMVSIREGNYEMLPMGQRYSSECNSGMDTIKDTIRKSLNHRKSSTIYKASNEVLGMIRPYLPKETPEHTDFNSIKTMNERHEFSECFGNITLCLHLTNKSKGTIKLTHKKIISDKKQEITTIHLSTFKSGVFEPFTQAQKNTIERLITADLNKNRLLGIFKRKEKK